MLSWLSRMWSSLMRTYRFRRAELWLPLTLGIAVVLSVVLYSNGQAVALHLAQVAVLWALVCAVYFLPAMVRHWRQTLLVCAATAGSLLLLWLAGDLIASKIIFSQYNLTVDHRPKPAPGKRNEHGVQPDRPTSAYKEAGFNVIVLGDSFVEGVTLRNRAATFAALLERDLGEQRPDLAPKVANFGWLSSSPLLQRRQLQDIGAAYHPDLVLQCIDMTDFHDDVGYAARLAGAGGGAEDISIFRLVEVRVSLWLGVSSLTQHLASNLGVRTRHAEEATSLEDHLPDDRFFHLRQPLAESLPFYDNTWGHIMETYEEASRLGAGFALFVLPRYQQYDRRECPKDWEAYLFPPSDEFLMEPFRFFEEKSGGAPFPVHSLQPDFAGSDSYPTVFESDPHFNETGHEVAAGAILRYLRQGGLIP